MIEFEPISNGTFWAGTDWTVTDEDKLAEMVARVALGQSRHVQKILGETVGSASGLVPSAVDGAIRLLTAANPKEPWHRDGWLFQVIAWIAAHMQDPESLKSAPHMIHAHKGFDCLHLRLDASGNVLSVVICEQKATGTPRKLITAQVWPEFKLLEAGTRDNELIAEITALLEKNGHLDPDEAVGKVLWEQSRAYCVAVTISDSECSKEGRKGLFKGYKKIVAHPEVNFRRAETFHQKALRKWMASLADKAIQVIRELEAEHV